MAQLAPAADPKVDFSRLPARYRGGMDAQLQKTYAQLLDLRNSAEGESKTRIQGMLSAFAKNIEAVSPSSPGDLALVSADGMYNPIAANELSRTRFPTSSRNTPEQNRQQIEKQRAFKEKLQGDFEKNSGSPESLQAEVELNSQIAMVSPFATLAEERKKATDNGHKFPSEQEAKKEILKRFGESVSKSKADPKNDTQSLQKVLDSYTQECKLAVDKAAEAKKSQKATDQFMGKDPEVAGPVESTKVNPSPPPQRQKDFDAEREKALKLPQYSLQTAKAKLAELEKVAKQLEGFTEVVKEAKKSSDPNVKRILEAYELGLKREDRDLNKMLQDAEERSKLFAAGRRTGSADLNSAKLAINEHYMKGIISHPFGAISNGLLALESAVKARKK